MIEIIIFIIICLVITETLFWGVFYYNDIIETFIDVILCKMVSLSFSVFIVSTTKIVYDELKKINPNVLIYITIVFVSIVLLIGINYYFVKKLEED